MKTMVNTIVDFSKRGEIKMYLYTFEHIHTKQLFNCVADNAGQAIKKHKLQCNLWVLVDKIQLY